MEVKSQNPFLAAAVSAAMGTSRNNNADVACEKIPRIMYGLKKPLDPSLPR